MREARILMGMPITVEVIGREEQRAIEDTFTYFDQIDARFSTYKPDSEIMQINRHELPDNAWSSDMKTIFALAEQTRKETEGYFNIEQPSGLIDPSGIVKGWAINNAARQLRERGYSNYFINAGGDVASCGHNAQKDPWSIGIQNPFVDGEIVKIVYPLESGVATSGSYRRGAHIYNPHEPTDTLRDIVSITVIGKNVLEADRFATGAFAMGGRGIAFLEQTKDLEGYQIDSRGTATMTTGFEKFTTP
jgi:thiamine biosynthesis lipoprotein